MRPTTAIQLLTSILHVTTPNPNPRATGAHLPYLLTIIITETVMALVQPLVLVLLHLATSIHHIAIPKEHLPLETLSSAQTLQSISQIASIQRAIYSPKRARTRLSKSWRII
jgi:hypothetical protein